MQVIPGIPPAAARERSLAPRSLPRQSPVDKVWAIRAIFAIFPAHDVVSWNTLLEVLPGDSARDFFLAMPQRDEISWNTMCSSLRDLGISLVFFQLAPWHSARAATALITLLAESGQFDRAKRCFDSMPQRDEIAWASMIHALSLAGDLDFVTLMFARVPQRSSFSWNTMIKIHGQCGRLEDAVTLFDQMPEPTAASWTILIAAHAQRKQLDRSRSLFDAMPSKNIAAWTALLDGCSIAGLLDHAAAIYAKMPQHDQISMSAHLTAHARSGCLDRAREIHESIPEPCISAMNALIQAHAQAGRLQCALSLLQSMILEGSMPNERTYIGILVGYCYFGKIDTGRDCFISMIADHGISPCEDHYACMIHLMGRANRQGDAQELIEKMPFRASEIEWTSLLDWSRIHGDMFRVLRWV
ncbi:pentatricopeptide repeat-containing protein At4g02750-like [Selaginella moellendorffii]|uniref:pentatricopeptide repeat-containing protein At4g02750-like n=1 Tax=Selaginella moellendorffii TaxID=88036 RepID=UPI000D1C9E7B|nr:pentatricopeptide repeat-containing protein At4g02750-like [Selaginella moellendorffii]|eukprot:XP_024524541.1 pentatricopeptide repeat-containing protein At4g02750-like [Selaginella moellendorffii]